MEIQEKILADSLYSAVSSGVSLLRGVVAIPLITKLLGAGEYGVWTVILTLATVVKTLGGVHLHGALIRYQHDGRSEEQSYADTLALTALLAAVVAALSGLAYLAIGGAALADLVGRSDVGLLSLAAVALVASEMVFAINRNFPRAKGNIPLYEFASVGRLFAEILALAAAFLLGGGLVAGLVALLAVNVGTNAVIVAYVFTAYPVPSPDPSAFPQYLRFGLPMVPKDLSGYLLTHSDRYLILYFLSPSAVGVYAVVYGLSAALERVAGVLNPTLYPTIADAWDAGRLAEIRTVYANIFRYYTILALPAFVGVSVLAGPLLEVLSTPGVARRGAPIVPLVALAFILRGYETVVEYILTAAEATDRMAVATGVASGINLALNVAMIPWLGILGAAVTTLLSQAVFTGMVYRYAVAHVSVPLPTATALESALCAALMGALLASFPFALTDVQTLVVYPAVGAAAYFAGMLLLGAVSVEELASVVRAVD